MVTAIYRIVHLHRGRFVHASAGPRAPFLLGSDEKIEPLVTRRMPLAVGFRGDMFTTFEHVFRDGDTLVLYTDGLVEYGRDPAAGELWLVELLSDLVRSGNRTTLARALHAATFSDGARQHDDVAVLTISLVPPKRRTLRGITAATVATHDPSPSHAFAPHAPAGPA